MLILSLCRASISTFLSSAPTMALVTFLWPPRCPEHPLPSSWGLQGSHQVLPHVRTMLFPGKMEQLEVILIPSLS